MFRCLLSACIVAAQDPLRVRLGVGWLFVLFAGLMAGIVLPLLVVERKCGPRWREARRARSEAHRTVSEAKT